MSMLVEQNALELSALFKLGPSSSPLWSPYMIHINYIFCLLPIGSCSLLCDHSK